MIEVIKSPQPITEKTQWTVFLAGPMNGAPSWQAQAPKAREMKPHRVYAITTRLEMAENLARGHQVIIGVDPECDDLAGIHHLKRMAKYYGVKKIHTSLEDCMKELKARMERPRKEEERIHHMPGPRFEPMGTLKHVPQPNTNRNQTLMEHWNQQVAPGDTVYVDGDFGAEEWKPFLNGTIIDGVS